MEIAIGDIFPLTSADLSTERAPVAAGTPPLQRIRAAHHYAARLLATGMKAAEVSVHTGFCQSRLSILAKDPSFNELIAHYREVEEEVFVDARKRVAALGVTAAEALHDRLLDRPDDISTKDLTNLLATALDRGGYAPVQKSISVSSNMGAAEIAALREALGTAPRKERIIEGDYSNVPADTAPGMGSTDDKAVVSAEASEGGAGEGTGV